MRRPATALLVGVLAALTLAAPAQAAPKKKKAVPPIVISGTVYTFDNQVPIAGATVRIAELPNLQATTDPSGSYSLAIPGGTVFTPYADAVNHKRIYLQTFVSEGQDLRGVNFQMPTQGAYDLLAAIVGAPRDASGEIINCAVVSTFSAQQVRDLSHDAFRAYGAHGVAGAVAAAEPALPKPIYFNEQVIPDQTRTNSSIDGGVVWPIVPTGVYRFTGFHPSTTFAPFRATCAPGRVVNANPTRGLYELRPGETVDTEVDATRPRAKLRRSGKVQSLTVSIEAKEYVSISATVLSGGVPKGGGETRGFAPGTRNVKVPVLPTAGKRVTVEILAEDAEGNLKTLERESYCAHRIVVMAKAGTKTKQELFLIDGNSLAYRAFFALPESIATHDGRPTNAIYGLASMFAKMLIDHSPAAVVVAWDAGWSGREKVYKEYKAQRKSRPDLLKEQWPHFIPLAEAFGFANVRVEGFEADDVIASLTKRARERGTDVMVVSGDRDVYQLVEDGVRVMTTSRGVTDTKIYDTEGVIERYGVPPDRVTDLIGLKGDTSDNIPGVPGIGDKTAATLLQEFGSLEEVLANVDKISGAKRKENLTNHADDARVSKELATMVLDIDFELDLDEVMARTMDRGRLREFAREFELRQIIQRLEEELGEDYVPDAEVDEELEVVAEEGQPSDLAVGEAAIAIAGDRWAGADKKKVVAGDLGQLSELADALRPHPLIGHDIKSLGGGARHGLLAAAGDEGLDLRHDTMVGGYLLDPARRTYDLADIAAQRGLAAASAGDGDEEDGQLELGAEAEEEVADPAAEARLVFELAVLQRKSMQENGLEKLMDEVEMPLVEVLAEVERTGVKLDVKRLAEIGDGFEKRIAQLEKDIYKLAGDEFTIGSPQQLAEVLFVKLGLTKKRRGKTGFSTDARVLGQIRDEHEIIPKIETWRELTKLKSTYLDSLPELIDPDTGRIHTTFNQTATATGRLSSTNPNLQNIPIRSDEGRPIRSCFVAPRGQRLLSADYNQIELRILAHIAGEDALREIFEAGEDVHTATAAEVLGADPEKVTPAERSKAKMVNYGIAYGLSAYGLSDRLNIGQDEAGAYIDRYFERFPKVRAYITETVEKAREDGYVTTLLGRRRPIPELKSGRPQTRSQGERLAVNMPIQGTSADIIKIAMVNAHRAFGESGMDTRLVLQIHDELLFEGPDAEMEAAGELVEREMCAAFELDPPLAADVGVGRDWLSAK